MRMPIRVRVASYRRVRRRRWMWTCPACPDTEWGSLSRAAAHRQAHRHAATCLALREMNEAVICPNCMLYGRVAPACPVCLGYGWVLEDYYPERSPLREWQADVEDVTA